MVLYSAGLYFATVYYYHRDSCSVLSLFLKAKALVISQRIYKHIMKIEKYINMNHWPNKKTYQGKLKYSAGFSNAFIHEFIDQSIGKFFKGHQINSNLICVERNASVCKSINLFFENNAFSLRIERNKE